MTNSNSKFTDVTTAQSLSGHSVKGQLFRNGKRSERFVQSVQLGIGNQVFLDARTSRLLLDRAFDLWGGEPGFIDGYLQRLQSDGDAPRLRVAAKRAGLFELGQGNLAPALRYFNVSHYAVPSTGGGDSYVYDREILAAIDSHPLAIQDKGGESYNVGDRRRVAYIVYGASHENSVLVRLLTDFLKHHDRSRFEYAYFSCDVLSTQRKSSEAVFKSFGAELIASDHLDEDVCLNETEARLRDFAPDMLVGVAVLADYRNYYLFTRFPGARKVALCYGPPAQYVPFAADFAIGATWHPILDCPIDGAVVEIEATLPVRPQESGELPIELASIPSDAVVILAAGRSEKFSDADYWRSILEVLKSRANVFFVAVGLSRRPEFLDGLIDAYCVSSRVITVGWVANYQDFLLRADVLVDTYPSGGGLTMMDAMAFSIPVVSFTDDYFQPFDQINWNLGEELLPSEDLIVPRDDLSRLTELLSRMVDAPDLRVSLGNNCRDHVRSTRGNPERMVRRIESHYVEVMSRPASSSLSRNVPPPCLTCRTGLLAVLTSRLRSDLYKLKRFLSRRFRSARD